MKVYNILSIFAISLFIIIYMNNIVSAVTFNNLFYYDFNENSGTKVNNIVSSGSIDLNSSGNWTTGFLGASSMGGNGLNQHAQNTSAQLGLGANFSVTFWFNRNIITDQGTGLIGYLTESDKGWALSGSSNVGKIQLAISNDSTLVSALTTTINQVANRWYFGAMTYNGTGVKIYINATEEANATILERSLVRANFTIGRYPTGVAAGNFFNGSIDEVGIWNRTLTQQDINDLYNSGVGLPFSSTVINTISVVLNSPANNTNIINGSTIFNSTFTSNNLNITNATILIYYLNGSLFNSTVNTTVNNNQNYTIFNISNFVIPNIYLWNVYACGINNSGYVNCNTSSTNRTLTFSYVKNSETFNSITTSLASEKFYLNITTLSGLSSITAILSYNNTNYTTTKTSSGNNYSFSRQITIPNVNTQTNKNFYWIIQLIDSSGNTFLFNDDTDTQTITTFGIDNCTTNSQLILNYTLRDEDSQNVLTPNVSITNTTMEVELKIISINDPSISFIFNQSFNNTNPARICVSNGSINNSQSYRIDGLNKYYSTSRVIEYHNIQNFTLTNNTIPQNINLYDLLIVDSVDFLFIAKDENFLPIRGALIDIQRKYPADGAFKSVEIPKTNDGKAKGHLDLDEIYNIYLRKNGVLLATFENNQPFCNNILTGECIINLKVAGTSIRSSSFKNALGVSYVKFYNTTSKTYIFTFNTVDSSDKLISLNVTAFNINLNKSICNTQLTASSGSLTCAIPQNIGNGTAISKVYVDGRLLMVDTFNIKGSNSDVLGYGRFFFAFILVITLPLMAISNGSITLIFFLLGLVIAGLLGFLDSGNFFTIGALTGWIVISAILIVFKIRDKETQI